MIYLYTNDHVLIPRYSEGLYGSAVKDIKIEKQTSYYKKFYVTVNKAIRMNEAGQRCVKDAKWPVGHCIVKYLEETHNCTYLGLMANKTKPFCDKETTGQIVNTLREWESWPEVDMLDQTGCLPNCVRDEISLEVGETSRSWRETRNPILNMVFLFKDGTYQLQEEYVIYDMNDFIADVGGYLGLLLGHSVLSIYFMSVEWFRHTKIWRSLFKGQI